VRRSQSSRSRNLHIVNSNAAGVDLGSREHYVCAGESYAVRRFPSVTDGLREMSAWLKECGVTTVAMEATGVYWIPVFQRLERDGFKVVLVNARHFKNVPGRKSDVQDCQWLQHLHECGLLAGSFRPTDEVVVLRTYLRQRSTHIREAARQQLRMQKALDQMNIHLHKVVSDIGGETGMSILRAILAGERDPAKLAALRNYRVRRSGDEYVAALTGDWRDEHLFSLAQSFALYEMLQRLIAECDAKIAACCAALPVAPELPALPPAKTKKHDTGLRDALFRAVGVDLSRIDGMSPQTVLNVLGEVGLDMDSFPSEKHFASWLRLSPANRITGGRVHGSSTLPGRNRATEVFRKCAENLARSQSYLGAFYRRMRARKGGPYAVVATARKLACLFYRMLKTRTPYRDIGMDHYDQHYRERATRGAIKQLQRLGYEVELKSNQLLAVAVR
jgi:transposase